MFMRVHDEDVSYTASNFKLDKSVLDSEDELDVDDIVAIVTEEETRWAINPVGGISPVTVSDVLQMWADGIISVSRVGVSDSVFVGISYIELIAVSDWVNTNAVEP
jgi:hypothetical protein